MSRRSFRRRDDAVTEVIGYVLSFALSAIFLLIALNIFHAARGNTEQVVTGVELKTIADRVAGQVVELGLVSQEFDNATMNVTITIPQTLGGRLYTVSVNESTVRAVTNDGELSAEATTYKLDALDDLWVWGSVDSSNEMIRAQYTLLANDTRQIQIRGE